MTQSTARRPSERQEYRLGLQAANLLLPSPRFELDGLGSIGWAGGWVGVQDWMGGFAGGRACRWGCVRLVPAERPFVIYAIFWIEAGNSTLPGLGATKQFRTPASSTGEGCSHMAATWRAGGGGLRCAGWWPPTPSALQIAIPLHQIRQEFVKPSGPGPDRQRCPPTNSLQRCSARPC